MTVSWFGPQNQADFGLAVAPQNQWREVGVGHASRSSGLLHVEASLARVFQSCLKTGGGATPDPMLSSLFWLSLLTQLQMIFAPAVLSRVALQSTLSGARFSSSSVFLCRLPSIILPWSASTALGPVVPAPRSPPTVLGASGHWFCCSCTRCLSRFVVNSACVYVLQNSPRSSMIWFVAGKAGLFLSHRIKRLEDSWFKLFSLGGFLNTPTSCSVK
jgi:hypothetical protein